MQNKDFRFDRVLAQRFVNDMNLPIQVIDKETFKYWIALYENDYQSETLWNELWEEIDEEYNGDASKFLDAYYEVRDKVIKTVTESEVFKKFNESDFSWCKIETPLNPKHKELYNVENIGKRFLSFDLVKSNIQALNYADKEILMNSLAYEDFIGNFTDSRYIAKSKYFRQVVFGQMNPKRHITIAKYLISKVYTLLRENGLNYELVCVSSDEIVFEVPDNTGTEVGRVITESVPLIQKELGLVVRGTEFRLQGYNLRTDECKSVCNFYLKWGGNVGWELKGVPLQYHSIVYKLSRGNKVELYDKTFQWEKCKCVFVENFSVKNISNQ
jgi:hypothetical protein